ncbi:MAG: hypothetical protein KGH93_02275 [Patescibacteria group bacterium]|nr:hypothetical protein [Patescibacteria group bacterium]MDE1946004.1 hypothetical protein [Patescibacteria group bacterium]
MVTLVYIIKDKDGKKHTIRKDVDTEKVQAFVDELKQQAKENGEELLSIVNQP